MEKILVNCTGCGKIYDLKYCGLVCSCENINKDEKNHILIKQAIPPNSLIDSNTDSKNPYIVFKDFYYSYRLAQHFEINFEEIVNDIDSNLKNIGEPGFSFTALKTFIAARNSKRIKVFIKNETGNVAGSHKARHLMGNILYLEVLRKAGILKDKPELAIYSCGNAAMGAAAIAKAAGYKLKVFIPEGVNPKVIAVLKKYDAEIIVSKRIEGETGDPCYLRFQEALKSGSVPFSCSGPDNWSNIEGGQSLAQELFLQLRQASQKIDSIVIQIGGGALASSAIQTVDDFLNAKIIHKMPKVFTVQTEGGFPLVRAYCLLLKDIADKNNLKYSLVTDKKSLNENILKYLETDKKEIENISEFIRQNFDNEKVQTVLKEAAVNRGKYMWAWETEPHSIAHGILDDITYDWFKIIQGMFKSGGIPIIVSETELIEANKAGKVLTNIKADHTGTSGFTGFLKLVDKGWITEENTAAVFFTGLDR